MHALTTVFACGFRRRRRRVRIRYLHLVIAISVLSLAVAFLFARSVIGKDAGTRNAEDSNAIRQGAEAFLRRQYTTIVSFAVALAVVIYLGYAFGKAIPPGLAHDHLLRGGALCSLAAGFAAMWVSIRANIRVASAARKDLNQALKIALHGAP